MDDEKKYLDRRTGELRRGNKNFFQFYKHNFKLIIKIQREVPMAATLFFFLVDHMDKNNGVIISQKALADIFEVNRTTIYRNVKVLVDEKLIKIVRSGNTSIFYINADVVWQKTRDSKDYAVFNSRVILSQNEADQFNFLTKSKNIGILEFKKLKQKAI